MAMNPNNNSNGEASLKITPSTTASATITEEGTLFNEANRLATFHNWPNPNISPQSLAKAGFFYLNHSDEVKCAWCKGVIARWEKEDNAFEEHKRFFPECPRVQLGPLIEIASDGIRDLGIQQISPPKKPKYASLDMRLRSYTNWPIREIQSPEALAHAGLYYQDVDDQVRCFHCNIGLRSWQKDDNPWHEHAKWYPQCQFVNLVKGAQYVQEVQEMLRLESNESNQSNVLRDPGLTPTSIDNAMTTSPVLQALEMGIDVGSIRNITCRRLLATGEPYSRVEDLIKAVFDDRNEDDEQNEEVIESPSFVSRLIDQIFNNSSSQNEISTNQYEERSVGDQNIKITSTTVLNENYPIALESTKVKQEESTHPLKSTQDVELNQNGLSLEEENRKLKDARLCKVCLDEEVGIVFLPCGHLVTCVQCAPSVTQCPMCRSFIKGFVRTYLA